MKRAFLFVGILLTLLSLGGCNYVDSTPEFTDDGVNYGNYGIDEDNNDAYNTNNPIFDNMPSVRP